MVSAPGAAFESSSAWRNEPAPASAVFKTVKTASNLRFSSVSRVERLDEMTCGRDIPVPPSMCGGRPRPISTGRQVRSKGRTRNSDWSGVLSHAHQQLHRELVEPLVRQRHVGERIAIEN